MEQKKFRKKKNINEFEEGELVNDLFVVRFKKPVRQARNGNYWFELKIQDAGGDIMLKYWGNKDEKNVNELYSKINKDDVILAKGVVRSYNERLELSVNDGDLQVVPPGQFEVSDFIRRSEKDAEKMLSKLKETIDSIQNQHYRKILDSFFGDEKFLESFKRCPAAVYKHHGWLHGLLEHTLNVSDICDNIASNNPKLDRDLAVTGALLHDVGKIRELEATTLIKVTDEGNLLGHIVIAIEMFLERTAKLDIPEIVKQKVLHIIVSHHGHNEFGSPRQPAFPEAFLVFKADELDAFLMRMIELKDAALTEDSFFYSKDFGNIYLK